MRTQLDATRVLIYGDSLVYGLIPASGGKRYDPATRFTGKLQNMLGDTYDIIEEGQRGRMLVGENAFFPQRNGAVAFGPIFSSHGPLDVVVLFLGTNDMNAGQERIYEEMLAGVQYYCSQVSWRCDHMGWVMPEIFLAVPPCILPEAGMGPFARLFAGAAVKSKVLLDRYARIAETLGLKLIDCSTDVSVSLLDGIHLDVAGNELIASRLADAIVHR